MFGSKGLSCILHVYLFLLNIFCSLSIKKKKENQKSTALSSKSERELNKLEWTVKHKGAITSDGLGKLGESLSSRSG